MLHVLSFACHGLVSLLLCRKGRAIQVRKQAQVLFEFLMGLCKEQVNLCIAIGALNLGKEKQMTYPSQYRLLSFQKLSPLMLFVLELLCQKMIKSVSLGQS